MMINHMVLITVSFMAGIWCAGFFSWNLFLLYVLACLAAVAVVWRAFVKLGGLLPSVAAVFFLTGMICSIHADFLSPTDISYYEGRTVVVSAKVSEVPQITAEDKGEKKVKYIVDVLSVNEVGPQEAFFAASGRVILHTRIAVGGNIADYGDKITFEGKIVKPHAYNNPGQADSVGALRRQGITAVLFAKAEQIRIEPSSAFYVQSWIASWRNNMITNMARVMPEQDAAVLTGMLFGGYSGIDRDVVRDFATTGIVHILSVSGAHIALVCGVVLWLGGRLGMRQTLIAVFAAAAVFCYAVLAGLTPPVVRSAVMGLVILAAHGFGREKDAPSALAAAAFVMLAFQPALIYDISFQLSFLSTAGLLFLYGKTAVWLSTVLPKWASEAIGVTLAAQLAVLPFAAWYFNSFSVSSFIANMVVVPVVEMVVIVGLLGALASLFIPVFGNILLVFCSLSIGFVNLVNSFLAKLPLAKLYIPSFYLTGSVIYYLVLAWLYGYHPPVIMARDEVWRRWPRQCILAVFLLAAVCFGLYLYPKPVYVHFIDVGQGDAALITTPHGHAVIIDTGGALHAEEFDVGERVVLPYLRHYGVLSVDYLFLTHGHQDHAGGAAAIIDNIPVKNIFLTRDGNDTAAVKALEHITALKGQAIQNVEPNQHIVLDGVAIDVRHAVQNTGARTMNETSSVFQVCAGKYRFLFTGDLEKNGEAEVLAAGEPVESTVLKVGHHGAKTSSTSAFLDAVSPRFAVISVGYNNQFGHPHREVLQRLQERDCKVYRTDRNGAVVFRIDGEFLSADTVIK